MAATQRVMNLLTLRRLPLFKSTTHVRLLLKFTFSRNFSTELAKRSEDLQITCAGKLTKDEMSSIVCSKKFKTWIYLCEDHEENGGGLDPDGMAVLENAAESGAIELAHMPLRLTNLSTLGAPDLYQAYSQMEKPIFLSCSNGLRAHAVKVLCEAISYGETSEQTFERIKETKSRGVLSSPHVVQWLIGCIDGLHSIVEGFFCRQLYDHGSSSFSYLIACQQTREAVIIDPVLMNHQRNVRLIDELEFQLLYAIDTHIHEDRPSALGAMKQSFLCQTAMPKKSNAKCSFALDDNAVIKFGDYHLDVWSTPGHTSSCMTLVLNNRKCAFTGDSLMIRDIGRTDLSLGSSNEAMFNSLHRRILTLPADTTLYPAHNAEGLSSTTVAEEREYNPYLSLSFESFCESVNKRNKDLRKAVDMADNIKHNITSGDPTLSGDDE